MSTPTSATPASSPDKLYRPKRIPYTAITLTTPAPVRVRPEQAQAPMIVADIEGDQKISDTKTDPTPVANATPICSQRQKLPKYNSAQHAIILNFVNAVINDTDWCSRNLSYGGGALAADGVRHETGVVS